MYALAGPCLLENGLVQCAFAAKPDVPSASVARTSGYMCTIYIYKYIYIYIYIYSVYNLHNIYIYIYYVGYIHYTV
jgi:hypothetical protein